MAKIKDSCPKSSSGGYERVFADKQIGDAIQRVQSTVIRNGNELEKIIESNSVLVADLSEFLDNVQYGQIADGVFLCAKGAKNRKEYLPKGHDPDLLIFQIMPTGNDCYIVELKDGDNFDTKKASGEKAALEECKDFLETKIPFVTNFYVCAFNQTDRESIVAGFKHRFDINHVMTGKELCDILEIDYEEILENRKKDASQNVEFFVAELLKSPLIRIQIGHELSKHISEPDFYMTDGLPEVTPWEP